MPPRPVKAAVAPADPGPNASRLNDDAWFARMKDAGIDALGMHLEAVTPEVRERIMPGKAAGYPLAALLSKRFAGPRSRYSGGGQVSTYNPRPASATPKRAILETARES